MTMNFVLKVTNVVLKTIYFVFKMTNLARNDDGFCIQTDGFCAEMLRKRKVIWEPLPEEKKIRAKKVVAEPSELYTYSGEYVSITMRHNLPLIWAPQLCQYIRRSRYVPAASLSSQVSKTDELCIKSEEFCIQNDEFCSSPGRHRARRPRVNTWLSRMLSSSRGWAAWVADNSGAEWKPLLTDLKCHYWLTWLHLAMDASLVLWNGCGTGCGGGGLSGGMAPVLSPRYQVPPLRDHFEYKMHHLLLYFRLTLVCFFLCISHPYMAPRVVSAWCAMLC